jgi:hypothetical protein
MKRLLNLLTTGIMGIAMLFAYAQGNTAYGQTKNESMVVEQEAKEIDLTTWPETARMAANNMMEKYGQPDGITSEMLVWYNTGPFKRTVVYKEEVQHDFPMPHKDVLEQFVDYEVPADKFDELAMYDGSVIVERTKGEMSARCDKEGANFLALNLAHDIVEGDRSVQEAREFYANAIREMLEGNPSEYMQGLQFDKPVGDVGYSDKTVMDMSKVKELKQKKKQK